MANDRWRVAALLSAGTLVLLGCSADADEAEAVTEPAEEVDEPAEEVADPAEEVDDTDDPPEEVDEPAEAAEDSSAEPLARHVHEVADTGGSTTVTIDVAAMEVVGELLRVRVVFTPSWDIDPEVSIQELLGAPGPAGMSIRLLDPVNLLEYRQVLTTVPNATPVAARLDESTEVVFYVGAPVEPADAFDVHFDFVVGRPAFPALLDVPYEGS